VDAFHSGLPSCLDLARSLSTAIPDRDPGPRGARADRSNGSTHTMTSTNRGEPRRPAFKEFSGLAVQTLLVAIWKC
jgi:hypothetical protein